MNELDICRDRCLDVIDVTISKRLHVLLDNDKYADAKAVAQEMFLTADCPEHDWDSEILFLDDITGMTDEELSELEFDVTLE